MTESEDLGTDLDQRLIHRRERWLRQERRRCEVRLFAATWLGPVVAVLLLAAIKLRVSLLMPPCVLERHTAITRSI